MMGQSIGNFNRTINGGQTGPVGITGQPGTLGTPGIAKQTILNKIICIDDTSALFTKDKIYTTIGELSDSYLVKNDEEHISIYPSKWFQPLREYNLEKLNIKIKDEE